MKNKTNLFNNLSIVIIILITGLFSISATSNTVKTITQSKNISSSGVKQYSLIPNSSESFGKNFTGSDLKALIIYLQKNGKLLGLYKDEFTSISDLQEASEKATEKLNEKGKFVFLIKPNLYNVSYSGIDLTYDPEIEAVKIHFLARHIDNIAFLTYGTSRNQKYELHRENPFPQSFSHIIGVKESLEKEDSYFGKNGFGATAKISRSIVTDYMLGFSSGTDYREAIIKYHNLSMPRNLAKVQKANLALAVVCKVNALPVVNKAVIEKPTLDSLEERLTEVKILPVEVEQWLIIDQVSGKVIDDFDIQ